MNAGNAVSLRIPSLATVVLLASCGGGGNNGPPPTYTVGASVSGLSGSGLTLQLNGGSSLPVTGDGNVSFASALQSGASYAVTVGTQPSSPAQTCTVSNGSGTIGSSNASNVVVACVTNTYTVALSATGVSGSGLTVQINGGDNLNVAANGSATFSTPLASGTAYSVTVLDAPTGQACVVSNGSGTIGSANVNNVGIACGPGFTVSVTLSGLAGSSLVLALNANKQIDMAANGTQTFSPLLPTGASYAVTVVTQPSQPAQTCVVANSSGTIGSSNVTLNATCTVNPPQYSIGGTVTSLAGTGLTLQLSGGAPLTVPPASTSFSFPTTLLSGASYAVTLKTQPTNPTQTCTVSGGSGTVASSNVTTVQVVCPLIFPTPVKGDWTLMTAGSDYNVSPSYGTQGIGSALNTPGSRIGSATWTDAAGNLWLSGGQSIQFDILGSNYVEENDLWEYTPSTGTWKWVTGSSSPGAAGVYGTQGVAAASNTPGARDSASAWKDAAGNFWLFGGSDFNDLWKFDPAAGMWTWVSGSNTAGASGVYGSQGTAAAGNVPGARSGTVAWIDAQGKFWLFGGFVQMPGQTLSNDLWKYDPTTGFWAWMSGSVAATSGTGPSGIYGTKGTAASLNVPGARHGGAAWVSGGKLWLFGGTGNDSAGTQALLNDAWTFDPGTGFWTWVAGANTANSPGVYTMQGTASATSEPSGRSNAQTWFDSAGNFWLFGGIGFAPSPGVLDSEGYMADLWKFDPSTLMWTWVAGPDSLFGGGGSATPGVPSATALPINRFFGVTWIDANGNFWLLGGMNQGSPPPLFGDIWVYTPVAP